MLPACLTHRRATAWGPLSTARDWLAAVPSRSVQQGSWGLAIGVLVLFFQAEDGIRDYTVTGVQTCALPIYRLAYHTGARGRQDTARLSLFRREDEGSGGTAGPCGCCLPHGPYGEPLLANRSEPHALKSPVWQQGPHHP